MQIRFLIILSTFIFFTGCSTMSLQEKEKARSSIETMAEKTLKEAIAKRPIIQERLDNALGYAVGNIKVTKVPVVGAGGGNGLFVDLKDDERRYLKITRIDIGGGWGAKSYKVIVIINSEKIMDEFRSGVWNFEAGAEMAAGTVGAEGSSSNLIDRGFRLYRVLDGGASATVTARLIRVKIDQELTLTEIQ